MKKLLLFVLCAAILIISCEGKQGPTGPQGPRGPAGNDLEITVIIGILLASDLIDGDEIGSPNDFWEIYIGKNLERSSIFNVLVRPGSNYTWIEPEWDFWEYDDRDAVVDIYDDDLVDPGFEYRIAIAY